MLRAFTGSKPHDVLEAITEYDASYGDSAWDMLPRLRNVPDAARTPHIPIVFTKGDPDDKATGGGSVKHGIPSGPGGCIRRRLPTKIAPGGEEFVIARRRRAHSFRPLAIYLSRYGVDSLMVMGTATSGCRRATVVDDLSHGHPVFLVPDGCF